MAVGQSPNVGNSKQIGAYQKQGNNLLTQLEDRVSRALKLDNSGSGAAGDQLVGKVNPQDVKNYIAEISQGPVPGANIHNII
ncbi:MAG: hypothetical protein KKA31_00335 [Candidatus Margulisbacteria bacterium]|nr:hypothetical protein [Candidatus Margulisiibacteriota bacterium]